MLPAILEQLKRVSHVRFIQLILYCLMCMIGFTTPHFYLKISKGCINFCFEEIIQPLTDRRIVLCLISYVLLSSCKLSPDLPNQL